MNGSVFRISRWYDLGFNVLAVDYRGFGKKHGDPALRGVRGG